MFLLAVLFFTTSGLVPQAEHVQVAENYVQLYHPDAQPYQTETFTDLEGESQVHAYVYQLPRTALDADRAYDEADEHWGVDRYATVIVGARYSQPPVYEISNVLPACIANRDKALTRAKELWEEPELAGYVYLSPLNEWFKFNTAEGIRYLHSRKLIARDISKFEKSSPQTLSRTSHPGWQRALQGGLVLAEENKVEDVPFALWSYGCSPTASSMIFDYWDRHGYPRLVDFYFDRWDHVQEEEDRDLTNVHRELAIAMHTDSMYQGGTSVFSITPGHMRVANSDHGYSFSGSTYSGSNAANFGVITDEIDDERPVHWSVGNYDYGGQKIYHSVCAVGYEITTGYDSLVIVHNTWDRGEHRWAYQTPGSYSNVYPLEPGGEQEEDLRLTIFTSLSIVYEGFTYPVAWESEGGLGSVEVYRAENDDRDEWEHLGTTEAQKGYLPVELTQEFTGSRINIEGYKGSSLKAADGTPRVMALRTYDPSPSFEVRGHLPAQGYTLTSSFITGDYLYALEGNGRVCVTKVEGDYLVPLKRFEPDTFFQDAAFNNGLLYLIGYGQLTIYDISEPTAPQIVDAWDLTDDYQHIQVNQGFIYAGSRSGLSVLRLEQQQLVTETSLPDSFVLDLEVIGDSLYVSCHGQGVKIYDISDPSDPRLDKVVQTSGTTYGVGRYNSTLVAASKSRGFELIDLASGESRIYDPGSVYGVVISGDRILTFQGQDGLGVYKITGSLSAEYLGAYVSALGSVEGASLGEYLYLGCGFDGLFALESDLVGIAERGETSSGPVLILNNPVLPGGSPGYVRVTGRAPVQVDLYEVTGRRVMHRIFEADAGDLTLPGTPSRLGAGVYFIKVETGGKTHTGKVVVLR